MMTEILPTRIDTFRPTHCTDLLRDVYRRESGGACLHGGKVSACFFLMFRETIFHPSSKSRSSSREMMYDRSPRAGESRERTR